MSDRCVGPTAGVVSLSARRAEPDARVVAVLEDALVHARSGRMVAVGVCAQLVGGVTSTTYELGDGDLAHLTHALSTLHDRLLIG